MGEMIDLDGFAAYLAEPAAGEPDADEPSASPRGALIVIHEIWGLVDHIKHVTDRFAAEGYLVLAPDLLSEVGIDPRIGEELQALRRDPDPAKRSAGQPLLREKMAPMQSPEYAEFAVRALKKCVDYLAAQPGIGGRIAVTGFCFGGTYTFALAAADSRVRAAAPFYGAPPALDQVGAITAPVFALYGGTDERLMASLPEVTTAMTDAGVDFTTQVYDDAGHAFFNDTNPFAYNAEAAADAWTRVLSFLERSLAAR